MGKGGVKLALVRLIFLFFLSSLRFMGLWSWRQGSSLGSSKLPILFLSLFTNT